MTTPGFSALRQVDLDSTDARGLAESYREPLGAAYRDGDEAPPAGDEALPAGEADARGRDWLVLVHPSGAPRLAFQRVARPDRAS
jgi:hypothetical protein